MAPTHQIGPRAGLVALGFESADLRGLFDGGHRQIEQRLVAGRTNAIVAASENSFSSYWPLLPPRVDGICFQLQRAIVRLADCANGPLASDAGVGVWPGGHLQPHECPAFPDWDFSLANTGSHRAVVRGFWDRIVAAISRPVPYRRAITGFGSSAGRNEPRAIFDRAAFGGVAGLSG